MTKDSLFRAAQAGVDWIVRNQQPDGRFLYYYDATANSRRDHEHPKRNPETDPYYNLLRHCGGVITALLYHTLWSEGTVQPANASEQEGRMPLEEPLIRRSAESAIDFFLGQLVPYVTPAGQDAAYACYNKKAKLGGSGLGLYMLAFYQKLFGDAKYADHAQRLGRHLVGEFLDTGEFMYYHVYLDKRVPREANRSLFSFYYPGVAIIGLANYCAHVCQSSREKEAVYARLHDALRFLILDRPRLYAEHFTSLPSDSWLTMGINDLWDEPQFRNDMYSRFVFQDADQMVAHVYTPRRALYPDYVGSFYYQYGDHPYPDGARAEGLMAAYMLARKIGDQSRIDRHAEGVISELNTWPVCTPCPCNTHEVTLISVGFGAERLARPFSYDSFIRYSRPVYPGAFTVNFSSFTRRVANTGFWMSRARGNGRKGGEIGKSLRARRHQGIIASNGRACGQNGFHLGNSAKRRESTYARDRYPAAGFWPDRWRRPPQCKSCPGTFLAVRAKQRPAT